MEDIFGPDAMNKYKSVFQGDVKRGFKKFFEDGSRDIEGIANSDEDNDFKENELD